MSDNNNYTFDPSFFLKLVNNNNNTDNNDNEAGDDPIFSNGNGNATEISEEDLLMELEALSGSNITKKEFNTTNSFNVIRSSLATDDFNIENMTLTPEDETNPELLAELVALLPPTNTSVTSTQSEPKISSIDALKKEILTLKRQGDLEGAKAKFKDLKELELLNGTPKLINVPLNIDSNIPLNSESNIPLIIESNSARPQAQVAVATNNLPPPSATSKDSQVYRDLFAKLQRQTASCQAIAEFYTSSNRKSEANLFYKRKQAFDLELQKLRLMLKSKQPVPLHRTVNVTYEHFSVNPDIPEGELHLSLGQLQIILPRKFKLKATEEYRVKLNFELFGLTEAESTLTSGPFTTHGLSKNDLGPFIFKCNKRDIRAVKSVEYKKFRVEVITESGFLFFKSTKTLLMGQSKLDRLAKECNVIESIDLFDVEEGKRSAIPSAKLQLSAKLRSPLTSDGFKQCTEKWIVIPSFGFSNHCLYSDLSPVNLSSPLVTSPKTPSTGTIADQIRSFEVIEYELGILAQSQKSVLEDPALMDLQVALESLRDRLQMQVELGQISLQDYLDSVKQCIDDTKRAALDAKRGGNLLLAQKYVKHVDIMRKEVSEAEASLAEQEQDE